MNNAVFIETGEQLTLGAYVPIAAHLMALIAEASKEVDEIHETFSIADISALLNKVTTHMAGEFEIRRTPSRYCQIVYEPYVFNEAEFEKGDTLADFTDTHDGTQMGFWVSEKALIAFIDRKLYGAAFMLYFHLGYLMTRDKAFMVSHNISFEKLVASCAEFPEGCRVKYRTTLMRAIADLEDAGLIKRNPEAGTFELLHITPYDPNQKV